jgi:hypothetical protein
MNERNMIQTELRVSLKLGIKAHLVYEAILGQMLVQNGLLPRDGLERLDPHPLLLVLRDMGSLRPRRLLRTQQTRAPKLGRRHMKHGRA